LPHAPQLPGSVDVLAQTLPHSVWVAAQFSLQLPALQTSPVLQTTSQLPQCAGSFWVSAQLAPHLA
jgi:hypothetical protein